MNRFPCLEGASPKCGVLSGRSMADWIDCPNVRQEVLKVLTMVVAMGSFVAASVLALLAILAVWSV